jgi:hypothetical protein
MGAFWIWWIAAAALIGAELLTGTFYLLAVGSAAAIGGLAAWLGVGPPGNSSPCLASAHHRRARCGRARDGARPGRHRQAVVASDISARGLPRLDLERRTRIARGVAHGAALHLCDPGFGAGAVRSPTGVRIPRWRLCSW